MSHAQQFFARINEKTVGPFDFDRLRSLVEAGHVTRETNVSTGEGRWVKAGEAAAGLFKPRPPEIPAETKRRPRSSFGGAMLGVVEAFAVLVLLALAFIIAGFAGATFGPDGFTAAMAAFLLIVILFAANSITSELRALRSDLRGQDQD